MNASVHQGGQILVSPLDNGDMPYRRCPMRFSPLCPKLSEIGNSKMHSTLGKSERSRRKRRPSIGASWACPRCRRTFRQVNQRHACGVGSAATLLKGRSPALTALYRKLEATVRRFGSVEVVSRNRYALFRTTRIFADLTVMRDALRVVIHLGRRVRAPYFIKVGKSGKRISHVALLRNSKELRPIIPLLREAYDLSVSEGA